MHLLRQGQFSVASTFMAESTKHPPHPEPTPGSPDPSSSQCPEQESKTAEFDSEELQQRFTEMYHILHELRNNKNLQPAIEWARARSDVLEARGSNLEFELCQLRFISLFMGRDMHEDPMDEGEDITIIGPLKALEYACQNLDKFQRRYGKEVQQLIGAMPYSSNMYDSPYRRSFHNNSAWEDVASSFTREFCSLLGLSADSPLYIASTAGAIALPQLRKMETLKIETKVEWTTQHELPVRLPRLMFSCAC